MRSKYDSIVIGGGILGCATAYELANLGQRVLVIEKGYLGCGSTGRCIGGIRQQFSTPGTIRLAMESVHIFEQMEGIEWYPGGYLFLAHSESEKKEYLRTMEIQHKMGLEVKFLAKSDTLKLVPILNEQKIIGGTYCNTDGQANPFLVIKAQKEGIQKLGSTLLSHTEVVKINTKGNVGNRYIYSLHTHSSEEYTAPVIINAAGPWLNEVNKLANGAHKLPIEPDCHEALITESTRSLFEPMIVSYSPSCYFQQLHFTGQIIGCYTPEEKVKGISNSSTYEFASEFSYRILKLMPGLADLKVLRSWVGWYEMTPDGNPIIGETNIRGLWVIGGASGHGFMFGPALGKCLAELICNGKTFIPVDEFLLTREFKTKEKLE